MKLFAPKELLAEKAAKAILFKATMKDDKVTEGD
jgi:hypothetical protein